MCVLCETHSECDTSAQTDRRRHREIQTECLINNQHHLSDHAAVGCFLTAHIHTHAKYAVKHREIVQIIRENPLFHSG
jgi:hypothetical protein